MSVTTEKPEVVIHACVGYGTPVQKPGFAGALETDRVEFHVTLILQRQYT